MGEGGAGVHRRGHPTKKGLGRLRLRTGDDRVYGNEGRGRDGCHGTPSIRGGGGGLDPSIEGEGGGVGTPLPPCGVFSSHKIPRTDLTMPVNPSASPALFNSIFTHSWWPEPRIPMHWPLRLLPNGPKYARNLPSGPPGAGRQEGGGGGEITAHLRRI